VTFACLRVYPHLILELDALATRCVNHAAAVRTSFPLVLLLGEAFALGDDQFCVRAVGVVVRNVCVACELRIDLNIGLDALEAVLYMAPFRLGGV